MPTEQLCSVNTRKNMAGSLALVLLVGAAVLLAFILYDKFFHGTLRYCMIIPVVAMLFVAAWLLNYMWKDPSPQITPTGYQEAAAQQGVELANGHHPAD